MSCYIMNHDNIRKIGYTLAEILNHNIFNDEVSIAGDAAACCFRFGRSFMGCYINGHFSGERISEILHRINAQAYAERYKEPDLETFSVPKSRGYSLYKSPVRDGINEIAQDWHYALVALIDCWLYQTDEGNAAIADNRLAVQGFSKYLNQLIVQHSTAYREAWSSF